MWRLLSQRLAAAIPTLVLLSIALIAWVHALPGSPVDAVLGEQATPETRASTIKLYGFDRPLWEQYLSWVQNLFHGDLGISLQTGTPTLTEFLNRFPADIELCTAGMIVGVFGGVPLGYAAARRAGGAFDNGAMTLSLIGLAVPVFFLAFLLKYLLAVKWQILPSEGRQDSFIGAAHPTGFYVLDGLLTGNPAASWDAIKHLVLPALAAGAIPLAVISRITRTAVASVLESDHVKFARVKGLSPSRVICQHVLRNALNPIVTSVGLLVATLLTGAVLTETVFGIPGVGQFLYTSITEKDYPTIQSFTLLIGVVYVLLNIAVDMSYGLIDPRVRRKT